MLHLVAVIRRVRTEGAVVKAMCLPLQDVVTRYASQTGHHVERRFGWDCHGLPVEYEIDKKLGALASHTIQTACITIQGV
jgi:isoleucyl-tRNA synthetase